MGCVEIYSVAMDIHSLSDADPALLDELMAPARFVLENYSRHTRPCPTISDENFVRRGFLRTLSQARSGRDFLQQQAEVFDQPLARASFFDSLHSSRRRDLLLELNSQLYVQSHTEAGEDLLAPFPELADRAVWAVDGHKIEHACHALRDPKGRHVAPNSLYLLCLHNGLFFNLAAVQGHGRYRHEMPVFRSAWPKFLHRQPHRRNSSTAPLVIADPAFIDHAFWDGQRQMRQAGVLMITRAKNNLAPRDQQARSFDPNDPVNRGVESDWLVTFDGGYEMRLIEYADPETGTRYQFLTTDLTLRPGVVAWLYLLRWRIEKVYDTAKNKLEETKGWATGQVAQEIQAHFLALTHNLLVLFRGKLDSDFGLREEKIVRKSERRLTQRVDRARSNKMDVHPLQFRMPRIVQLSLQFIRTLRNHVIAQRRLSHALPHLQASLLAYL